MTHAGTPDYYYDLAPSWSENQPILESPSSSTTFDDSNLRSSGKSSSMSLKGCDLWVEYKSVAKDFGESKNLPSILPANCLPTELQQLWLNRRFCNSGNVLVIVGIKIKSRAHGIILNDPTEWSVRQPREVYAPRLESAADIAAKLIQRLT